MRRAYIRASFVRESLLRSPILAALLVIAACTLAAPLFADEPAMFPDPYRQFRKPVATWRQVQSRNVVMQDREYTCGAASLATILVYCYGKQITEDQILKAALGKLTPAELTDREENGLSLEDLARGASQLGFSAAALELGPEKLAELPVPVIVRMVRDEFEHFVVYRGELDGRVFLADPLRGNVRMSQARFRDEWDGKVLAVIERGRKPPEHHALSVPRDQPVTPERQAARRSLFELPPRPLPRL
jgi:predicted double-glycine peptidase